MDASDRMKDRLFSLGMLRGLDIDLGKLEFKKVRKDKDVLNV